MAKRAATLPQYSSTTVTGGFEYFRTRITDAEGNRVALYGKSRHELFDKVANAQRNSELNAFRRNSPTVKEYCEK